MTQIDTSLQMHLVTVGPDGCFQAQASDRTVTFRDARAQPLTPFNLPSGTWPIIYASSDNEEFLYFTYFLSARLHKWLLDGTGARQHGLHADASEVTGFLCALQDEGSQAATVQYLLQKVRDHLILAPLNPPRVAGGLFNELEQTVAAAYLQKSAHRPAAAHLLHDFAVAAGVPLDKLLQLTKVPPGYDDPVTISNGTVAAPIKPADAIMAELELDFLIRIVAEIIEPFNQSMPQQTRPYRLGEFLDLPIEMMEVRAMIAEVGGGPALSLIDLCFSRELMNPAIRKDGQFKRICSALTMLKPFIAEVAEQQPVTGSVRLAFSDGGGTGARNVVAFDRHEGSASPLMPDLYVLHEYQLRGFFPRLTIQEFRQSFAKKRPVLFWRGTTTGHADGRTLEDFIANHRVRACLLIKDALGAGGDAKITQIHGVRPEFLAEAESYLEGHGIRAPLVPEHEFGRYQVYLDLPGNAAAWGTFRKYLMGCLVIRPESGRELLYYQMQRPWVHFIPATADLSDLGKIMAWVIAHPHEAAGIAYTGRRAVIEYLAHVPDHIRSALAAAMTYEVP